jgi:hypothetical protein
METLRHWLSSGKTSTSSESTSFTMPATTKQFPGFGLPIDHEGEGLVMVPLAVGDMHWASRGVSLREQRMLDFIGQITDKPDWEVKVFDDDIVSRWRAEAEARPAAPDGDVYMSQEMFDFVSYFPALNVLFLLMIPAVHR